MKVTLIFDDENGIALRDSELEPKARQLINEGGTFTFANELFLSAFRAIAYTSNFDHSNVVIKWAKNPNFNAVPDNRYRLDHWPNGFCDKTEHFLHQLF
jgi:hypothetical protein